MKTTTTILLLVLTFTSCQKEISFDGKIDYESKVFIECILFPGEKPKVYLSDGQPFFNNKVTPQEIFARNAQVEISSGLLKDSLVPDSVFDKFRCRWVPFYHGDTEIVYGQSYQLKVTYKGETYVATTSVTQPKVNINDVEYVSDFQDIYGGHDGVIIRLKDAPGEGNFYRFQMDRWIDNTVAHAHILDVISSYCTAPGELFLVQDLGRTIFSDAGIDAQNMELYVEVSFEYSEGDTAYVYIQSLDEKSAGFFADLDHQLQSIINPFVEPTIIHSTIDGTLGVFGSVVRSDAVLFIYPQDNP